MFAVLGAYFSAFVMLLIFIVSALIDPRKLRTGFYLLISVGLAVLTTIELVSDSLTDPGNQYDTRGAYLLLGLSLAGLTVVIVLGIFLVLNGVTMLQKEGRRLPNALALLLGISVLSYVAAVVVSLFSMSFEVIILVLFLSLPIMYVSFVFTAFVGYSLVYGATTRLLKKPVDAVIVLGAGLIRGRVTPLLAARLNGGLRVYDRSRELGHATIIVTSGGQGHDEPVSEAEAMAEYLIDAGTEPTHVFREDSSKNTQQNLEYSRAILNELGAFDRVAVVTNNFHAFRAALLMRSAGLDGYAYGARTARYYWPSATIREFIAVLRDHAWAHGLILCLLSLPFFIYATTLL